MGAMLESLGQTRGTLPFAVSQFIQETLTVTGTGVFGSDVSYSGELPFDSGPDRGVRVFLVVSNIGVLITPAALQPAIQSFGGTLVWRDANGTAYHLLTLASDLMAMERENNNVHILLPVPFFAAKPNTLGRLEFTCTALTGAASVALLVTANAGFYTDYADD